MFWPKRMASAEWSGRKAGESVIVRGPNSADSLVRNEPVGPLPLWGFRGADGDGDEGP